MAVFDFTGKNKQGKTVKGNVDAYSREVALNLLQKKGIVPLSLEQRKESFLKPFLAPLGRFSRVSVDQLVIFTRQLATMISAGLPIIQALDLLQSQARSEKFGALLKEASATIEGGAPLSKAFEAHPEVFDSLYINLIKAGESSGALDKIFERLAQKYEQRKELRSKTKGALIYPAIILFGMLGAIALMLLFVVPKVTSMYSSMDLELPLPTRIMIGVSDLALKGWWVIILGGAGGVFLYKRFSKTREGKRFLARLSFKIPIIGQVMVNSDLIELTSTLGLLLSSGVPIVEGLEIVAGSMRNMIYHDLVWQAIDSVKKGETLSASLSKSKYLPPIVPQMLAVGEETGKLDDVSQKLASYFQAETDQIVKNLSSAMEPVVLALLGVVVGAMMLAIILPIYKLTSAF